MCVSVNFSAFSFLFINPVTLARFPGDQFLLAEPQGDFLVGRLDGIGSVADVATNLDAHVTTNASGAGISGVCGAQHNTASLDDIQTFPDHGDNGAGTHVGNQSGEEGTSSQIGIMFLQESLISLLFNKKTRKRFY